MPKKNSRSILLTLTAFAVFLVGAALLFTPINPATVPAATESTVERKLSCVVIDAGLSARTASLRKTSIWRWRSPSVTFWK